MSEDGNAAIHYAPEGFDTSRTKLMGRHAAGEGFLQGFARHAEVETVYGYGRSREDSASFRSAVAPQLRSHQSVEWIPLTREDLLSRPGCLFLPGPGVEEMAWRRRHGDQRGFSLCGVTHTIASHRVMDAVGALHVAPVQPWDAIVCTSRSARATLTHLLEAWGDYLGDRLGARPEVPVQLPVIPLGVDSDRFAPSPAKAEARRRFRDRHGIADADLAVLFFGRLSFHAKANPLPMYLALDEAARRGANRVHLVQGGWFANESIEAAFRTGAARFCPSVNTIFVSARTPEATEAVWASADVFTSLSDNIQETFGLTPLEAMAAGLPVVVSDWDGYRDTVRDGVDGFLVPTAMPPAGVGDDLALRHAMGLDTYDHYIGHASQCTAVDVGACAEAYARLLSDAELRRTMGEAGRWRAREAFDWRVVIAAYQELWRELAERRRRADERAPPRAGRPRHPLRDDPFAVFQGYPLLVLDGGARVALRPGLEPAALKALRAHPLASMSLHLLASEEECEALLAHLSDRGPATVTELLARVTEPGRRPIVQRTLAWLAKVGIVSIAPAGSDDGE